jgi:hypothetical protein
MPKVPQVNFVLDLWFGTMYTSAMKQEQIVIRGVNPELVRRLKMQVADAQDTIKGYVLKLIAEDLKLPANFEVEVQSGDGVRLRGGVEVRGKGRVGQAVSRASEEARPPIKSGAVGRGAQKDRVGEGTGKKCQQHGKVMHDFGNSWVCDGPPSHKEYK